MGRKLRWFKGWSNDTLADSKVLSLTWSAKGVFWIVINYLRTQTDEPGRFIEDGEILTIEDIKVRLKRYQREGVGQTEGLRSGLEAVVEKGLLRRAKDGHYYVRRIAQEADTSTSNKTGGDARAAKNGHRAGHRVGDLEEEEEEKKKIGHRFGTPLSELPESFESTEDHRDFVEKKERAEKDGRVYRRDDWEKEREVDPWR